MFFKELSHLSRQKDRKLRKNHLFSEENAPPRQFEAPNGRILSILQNYKYQELKYRLLHQKLNFLGQDISI